MNEKTILLVVTSSIAAYKAAHLIREYCEKGADVYVAMTQNATRIIPPLTLATLSGHEVYTKTFESRSKDRMKHISLADRADIVVVAPATANIIGKMASGIGDDLVSTTLLTALGSIPILIAPAMNWRMYENPVVQRNIASLKDFGCHFVGPEKGRLADGSEGIGRLSPLNDIVNATAQILERSTGEN